MSEPVIRVEGLGKRYRLGGTHETYRTLRDALSQRVRRGAPPEQDLGELWALRDVTFDVAPGEVLGIIGRNGAGKSTLLKILSRITLPTEGRARILGRVGSLLEVGTGFHPELTGRENIYLNGAILGMRREEIDRKFHEIVAFSEIDKFLDTPVKRYSSGMYVRLAFAVAAHLEPEILLVDEVLAVGDLTFRRKCMGKMEDISQQGRTVLFVSHTLSAIRQLCTEAVWIDGGRIRQRGTADEVTAAYEHDSLKAIAGDQTRWEREESETRGKRAWIDCVELTDAEGRPCTQFAYGDSMRLVAGIGGEPQEGFTVDWFICNERGERISYGSANPMCGVYFSSDARAVSCEIGPLPLTSGVYRLRVGVTVWGLRYWDEWENAGSFQITRCDPYGTGQDHWSPLFGNSIIGQRWSVVERAEESA